MLKYDWRISLFKSASFRDRLLLINLLRARFCNTLIPVALQSSRGSCANVSSLVATDGDWFRPGTNWVKLLFGSLLEVCKFAVVVFNLFNRILSY